MADFEAEKMLPPGRNQEDLSGRDVVPQMREGGCAMALLCPQTGGIAQQRTATEVLAKPWRGGQIGEILNAVRVKFILLS